MNVSTIPAVTRPTAIRWRIAGLLLVIITLTFIDRFNMNIAAKYIQLEFAKHFGWTAALGVGAIVILSMGSLWFLVHPERSIDPV